MQSSILSALTTMTTRAEMLLVFYMENTCNAIKLKNLFMLHTNMSRNTALTLLELRFYVALAGLMWGNFSSSFLLIYQCKK